MSRVLFEKVMKRYGDVYALHELTLEITDGELLVLLGPSGSGKTTALRILAGLESLTSGHVYIGERVVDRLSPKARDIAMVFQDYALYPQMSVFDNLAFALRVQRVARAEIARRVTDAAAALEIENLLQRKPRELSGGQRQRVALGRALVRDPQVFLMDEPLSNLDAQLRTQTRGEITRLQRRTGKTTVFVTHDQVEAMTMGDRIAILRDGELQQVGTPAEVYEQPRNTFVAGFVGSPAMSFSTLSVSSSNGVPELIGANVRLRAPTSLAPGAEVVLGVRPEHAVPWRADAGLIGPLEGEARYVEALGRETFVGVSVSERTQFVIEFEERADIELGATVTFGLKPGRLHLFDPQSGEALGRL